MTARTGRRGRHARAYIRRAMFEIDCAFAQWLCTRAEAMMRGR